MAIDSIARDPELDAVIDLRRRHLSAEQVHRLERHAAEIFATLGLDLTTDATGATPRRFIRALIDATAGYDGDPKLVTVFDAECLQGRQGPDCRSGQVIEGPIPFYALCEHHALPFHGHAYVGYLPHERIVGISKLTRVVRLFAQRFTVQERLVRQVADALEAMLQPHGVAVYLEARHLCTEMRGVRETATMTRTVAWRGAYDADPALRAEFLSLCGRRDG